MWGKTTYLSVTCLRLVSLARYLIIQTSCLNVYWTERNFPHRLHECTHICNYPFFHVPLGNTVVNSSCSFGSRPAKIHLCRLKYTFLISPKRIFDATASTTAHPARDLQSWAKDGTKKQMSRRSSIAKVCGNCDRRMQCAVSVRSRLLHSR